MFERCAKYWSEAGTYISLREHGKYRWTVNGSGLVRLCECVLWKHLLLFSFEQIQVVMKETLTGIKKMSLSRFKI